MVNGGARSQDALGRELRVIASFEYVYVRIGVAGRGGIIDLSLTAPRSGVSLLDPFEE